MRSVKSRFKNLPSVIKDVVLVDDLGDSPAMCLRSSGKVFVTEAFFNLPKDYQTYIIGHEAGHIALNTSSEFEADNYAAQWGLKNGVGLTNTLYAMTKVLSFPDNDPVQNKEQELRVMSLAQGLFDYDTIENENPKTDLNVMDMIYNKELELFCGAEGEAFFGKKAQQRRAERRELRKEKKRAKIERKNIRVQSKANLRDSKAISKELKAGAKADLATQGISSGFGANLGGVVTSLVAPKNSTNAQPTPQTGEKNNVFVIVGFLVVLVVMYFVLKPKN
jgi:LPXTG-motif cell wall-anchored protein